MRSHPSPPREALDVERLIEGINVVVVHNVAHQKPRIRVLLNIPQRDRVLHPLHPSIESHFGRGEVQRGAGDVVAVA